jgi:citrate synthase
MTRIHRGLADVVVTETLLSRVDGEAGRLLLAGYPVEEIAPRASFEEMLFLLWNDRQPSPGELAGLRRELVARRRVPTRTLELLRSGSRQALPAMDALRVGVVSLALAHSDLRETELQAEPPSANQARALRLVAALPTLAAAHHRLAQGEEPVEPHPGLDHAANYLFMLTGRLPDPAQARALETYLNTTIDHGMNASTFTARVVASTRSDIASAVEAALGALKGPLHGGAPAPALDTVFELRRRSAQEGRSLAEVTEAWARATVGAGGRIMGFGHRVYRVRDPRADVLGAALERLFPRAGENPLYDDAKAVEAVILRVLAEAKPGRRIDTNVEFYTALLLHGLGLPSSAALEHLHGQLRGGAGGGLDGPRARADRRGPAHPAPGRLRGPTQRTLRPARGGGQQQCDGTAVSRRLCLRPSRRPLARAHEARRR